MARLELYHFEGCPACKRAKEWIAQLRREKPELAKVEVGMTDVYRTPDYTAPESFTYVPTFFLDGRKVAEGTVTREKVEELLRAAL